jgi:hypothetical protein
LNWHPTFGEEMTDFLVFLTLVQHVGFPLPLGFILGQQLSTHKVFIAFLYIYQPSTKSTVAFEGL